MAAWLNGIGLGRYLETFLANGFDDIDFLSTAGMTAEDLDAMDIKLPGHRKKLSTLYRISDYLDGSTEQTSEGQPLSDQPEQKENKDKNEKDTKEKEEMKQMENPAEEDGEEGESELEGEEEEIEEEGEGFVGEGEEPEEEIEYEEEDA